MRPPSFKSRLSQRQETNWRQHCRRLKSISALPALYGRLADRNRFSQNSSLSRRLDFASNGSKQKRSYRMAEESLQLRTCPRAELAKSCRPRGLDIARPTRAKEQFC